jgi:hypothetical protein
MFVPQSLANPLAQRRIAIGLFRESLAFPDRLDCGFGQIISSYEDFSPGTGSLNLSREVSRTQVSFSFPTCGTFAARCGRLMRASQTRAMKVLSRGRLHTSHLMGVLSEPSRTCPGRRQHSMDRLILASAKPDDSVTTGAEARYMLPGQG